MRKVKKYMTELSNLLKEAKPLYYEQKRREQKFRKACFSLLMIFTVFASGYVGYTLKSISGNDFIASSDTVNVIESYYPTDDYGLITVAY